MQNKIIITKNLTISRPTASLLLMTFLCVILLSIRNFRTDETIGFSLIWNLFLAWIPLGFVLIAKRLDILKYKYPISFLLAFWLLFFPNSTYIITDLMHLSHLDKRLLWYDSVGIFIAALTGLLLGLYSLFVAHEVLDKIFKPKTTWLIIILCMVLSGYGVYLGRFVRFNSWDLFTKPLYLIRTCQHQLSQPLALKTTAIFALITLVLYIAFIIVLPKKTTSDELFKNVS
jgi:uncharacterized membrane protein